MKCYTVRYPDKALPFYRVVSEWLHNKFRKRVTVCPGWANITCWRRHAISDSSWRLRSKTLKLLSNSCWLVAFLMRSKSPSTWKVPDFIESRFEENRAKHLFRDSNQLPSSRIYRSIGSIKSNQPIDQSNEQLINRESLFHEREHPTIGRRRSTTWNINVRKTW